MYALSSNALRFKTNKTILKPRADTLINLKM